MKTKSSIAALSLSLLLAFSASAFAQQGPNRQPQQQNAKSEKVDNKKSNGYTTSKFYYTKSKLSKAALRKKLLAVKGVQSVQFDARGSFFTIVFDSQKAPKDNLKKNLNGWGTPGQFK